VKDNKWKKFGIDKGQSIENAVKIRKTKEVTYGGNRPSSVEEFVKRAKSLLAIKKKVIVKTLRKAFKERRGNVISLKKERLRKDR